MGRALNVSSAYLIVLLPIKGNVWKIILLQIFSHVCCMNRGKIIDLSGFIFLIYEQREQK